jgi:hypothetical protein
MPQSWLFSFPSGPSLAPSPHPSRSCHRSFTSRARALVDMICSAARIYHQPDMCPHIRRIAQASPSRAVLSMSEWLHCRLSGLLDGRMLLRKVLLEYSVGQPFVGRRNSSLRVVAVNRFILQVHKLTVFVLFRDLSNSLSRNSFLFFAHCCQEIDGIFPNHFIPSCSRLHLKVTSVSLSILEFVARLER